MLFHRRGEVIVGVARERDGIGRVQLLDARRGERQHLHVDAGRIHFRQSLGIDVAQPLDQIGIAAADGFGPVFQLAPGDVEKSRRGEVFFKRDGAHGCYTPNSFSALPWAICSRSAALTGRFSRNSRAFAIEPYG